ncbi:alpha-N-arabinofuranosidase, partial [Paenibacillus darwinianus]
QPDLEWEKAGGPPYINEGQSILKKDGNVFLVYSGAGSWTPFYSLGMLSLKAGGDPLAAADWTKSLEPLLQMDEEAGVFGPGHNSFVPSPDGTEDWIVYHATSGISDGWNNRKARAQRVIWGADGMPQFGGPLSLDTAIGVPSGAGVFEAASAAIENGRMTFEHIPSSIDSEAPLLIRYRNTSGSAKKADMLVNGQAAGEIGLAKTDSDQSGYGYTTVKLTASDNAISFPAATEGWQIEAVEISRVEAESGQGEGGPQAEGNPFASAGGIMRTNEGEEALISFPNLLVPVKGAYTVRIAADNSAGREQKITIRTSDGVKKTVTIPATDRNAFALIEAVIMLPAGVFELTLETKGALAIDYLDIVR